jgi:geranylgeranyl pyrophosphate synthase
MIALPHEPFPELGSRLAQVLTKHLTAGGGTEPHLAAVIAEALARPGRLFRAALVWQTLTGLGWEPVFADSLACGVEYFHVASLLLDDLPCMDDATTRRGFACPHLEHGDATVILAALAFINRAYALIWRELAPLPQEMRLEANEFLDRELGLAGILNGQARDLRFGERPTSAREASRIAVGKTVALFRLALGFPALVGGARPAELKYLNGLCVHWGLFYQACNDLDDVGSGPKLGDSAARDAALVRPNLLLVLGPEAFTRRLDHLVRQAASNIDALVRINPMWLFLREAQEALVSGADEPVRPAVYSQAG